MAHILLVPALTPLYPCVSTSRSMCAVPNMAVFCSSLTSWFPGMLLTYFLNYFEMVPVIIIIIIIIIIILQIFVEVSLEVCLLGFPYWRKCPECLQVAVSVRVMDKISWEPPESCTQSIQCFTSGKAFRRLMRSVKFMLVYRCRPPRSGL